MHPPSESQLSVVQASESSQLTIKIGRAVSIAKLSAVHASASSQDMGVNVHTLTVSQPSLVELRHVSLIISGVNRHPLAGVQLSAVQASLSLQRIAMNVHPLSTSQLSVVQASESSQFTM